MTKIAELTELIVSNYVSSNKLSAEELPSLIRTVHFTLCSLGNAGNVPAASVAEPTIKVTPAQIRKSLADSSHLISFLDGKPYRLLKRHLTVHGLTPDSYREKFGLPRDYPMTAPDYSAKRSSLALDSGLGQRGRSSR
jgi:predicted transcriptional regulator